MTGKERAMVDPAQKSGNGGRISFIQLKTSPEFLYGNPLFGFAGLFHILFEKIGNFPGACHEYYTAFPSRFFNITRLKCSIASWSVKML